MNEAAEDRRIEGGHLVEMLVCVGDVAEQRVDAPTSSSTAWRSLMAGPGAASCAGAWSGSGCIGSHLLAVPSVVACPD
jgi:hypothetical protein